jgi:hypothetical protein
MTSKRPVRLVRSEVWVGRTEFETMVGPRVPEPAETMGSRDAGPRSIEVRPLLDSPRASMVAPLFAPAPAVAKDVTDDALIRLDGLDGHEPTPSEIPKWSSRARSRRVRLATAGALGLVLAGGAVCVPLLASHSGAAPVKAVSVSPPAAVPAPGPGSNPVSEPANVVQPAPAATPNRPTQVNVRPEPAAASASRTVRSNNRPSPQPQHAASAPTPPPADQVALEEASKWWPQAGEYGPGIPRWTHFAPDSPPRS